MDTLVELKSYIPGLQVELRYATENNFTGKVIYAFAEARLRKVQQINWQRCSRYCRTVDWG